MNNFVKIIKEKTGLSIRQFCEKELNTRYGSFAYRVKNGRITPAEIFYIVYRTKESVQELFGTDLQAILVNGSEGDFAEKVKGIIKDLSEEERANLSSLIGLQAHAPEKKKEDPESPVSQERESALDRLLKNIYHK